MFRAKDSKFSAMSLVLLAFRSLVVSKLQIHYESLSRQKLRILFISFIYK